MQCPVCHNKDSKVIDSRSIEEGIAIRRRRECEKCKFRFSTYEEVEILDLSVVKQDGRRENYIREKVENGLKRALEKRPVDQEAFKRLVSHVERDIQLKSKSASSKNNGTRREIETSKIGEIAIKYLKELDPVAYIRFASVYKSFEDIDSFKKELKKIS
ncbi:transcriptional regulator NrdR [Patescibacteria group bacterium]|nr:transcriptional regulator NrdR [Patescibacteria group bacterium]